MGLQAKKQDKQYKTEYYLGNQDQITRHIADILVEQLGVKFGIVQEPSAAAIQEHGSIIADKGGLNYCWDDTVLFRTEPLMTKDGLKIITEL